MIAAMLLAAAEPAPTLRFAFGPTPRAGFVTVPAGQRYDGRYGFEPGGALFSAAVPEGNYRVTVTLGDAARASRTTVKAESRRLMLDAVETPAGRFVTRSFVVNVRDAGLTPPPANAPGEVRVRTNEREAGSYSWDDRLTLEFADRAPAVAAVEIAPVTVPTIFLAGDSTVTDQRAEPGASWGQMLTAMMDDGVAIANHAESGETLKSFLFELRLEKVLQLIRPGDWLLIQFGHNDQKAQWPKTYAEAATTYRSYLRLYAAEARRRGAHPVFVTSPERRTFAPDGTIRPTLADYAQAMRETGAAERVPVIDLNAASMTIYQALGPARAPAAFSDGGRDATHHNNYGAWLMARAVAEEMREAGLPIARHLRRDMPSFDAARPPAQVAIAPSAAYDARAPRGN